MKKITPLILIVVLFAAKLYSGPNRPIGGDGTNAEYCHVTSDKDTRANTPDVAESLRQRLNLYNRTPSTLCSFGIFFLFHGLTITLEQPLTIENRPHDYQAGAGEVLGGTAIDGYGTEGENLHITIDALHVTENPRECAFKIRNGFAAKQQIHGLRLLVRSARQAICDENGVDLMNAITPNCDEGRTGLGRDDGCDFGDVTVIVVSQVIAGGGSGGSVPATGGMGGAGGRGGSGPKMGMAGTGGNGPKMGAGGRGGNGSGGMGGSGAGGSSGTGGLGTGGVSGTSGAGGGFTPDRNARPGDSFGCQLLKAE